MNIALFQKKVGDEKGQPLTHSKRHKLITKKERLKEGDTLSPQQDSQLFKHRPKKVIDTEANYLDSCSDISPRHSVKVVPLCLGMRCVPQQFRQTGHVDNA